MPAHQFFFFHSLLSINFFLLGASVAPVTRPSRLCYDADHNRMPPSLPRHSHGHACHCHHASLIVCCASVPSMPSSVAPSGAPSCAAQSIWPFSTRSCLPSSFIDFHRTPTQSIGDSVVLSANLINSMRQYKFNGFSESIDHIIFIFIIFCYSLFSSWWPPVVASLMNRAKRIEDHT